MNRDKVVEVMGGIPKGCNIVVEWERNGKIRKGVTDNITKAVRMVGRIGIEYDNIKAVQTKRENGELPAENQGLSWGHFEIYPYLIEHKGEHYLRLYKGTSPIVFPKVAWKKNNVEVNKDDIAPLLLKSEFDEKESDCFCVNVKNITRLHRDIEIETEAEVESTSQPVEV